MTDPCTENQNRVPIFCFTEDFVAGVFYIVAFTHRGFSGLGIEFAILDFQSVGFNFILCHLGPQRRKKV